MPRVELEDVADGLDGELVKGVGLLEVAGIGVSQGSQDLARSILVVDEGRPFSGARGGRPDSPGCESTDSCGEFPSTPAMQSQTMW